MKQTDTNKIPTAKHGSILLVIMLKLELAGRYLWNPPYNHGCREFCKHRADSCTEIPI
ncbi:hypothetical protein Hanom_Chr16g01447401 [Helianthus anomalus]